LKSLYIPKENEFDAIPVDNVTNALLVVTAYTAGLDQKESEVEIYHNSSSVQNPVIMEKFSDLV